MAGLRGTLQELLEGTQLILSPGEEQRAAGVVPDSSLVKEITPELHASKSPAQDFSGALPDGPQHPEVESGSSSGFLVTFEDDRFQASSTCDESVGQADDSRSDNRQVVVSFSLLGHC
jgi:hypothetical protein